MSLSQSLSRSALKKHCSKLPSVRKPFHSTIPFKQQTLGVFKVLKGANKEYVYRRKTEKPKDGKIQKIRPLFRNHKM